MNRLKLIAAIALVFAFIASADARPLVTQKIRLREIRKGTADLIWRVDQKGKEYFTVRVPKGEWQLWVIYADGWTFPVRKVHGGDIVSQFRDAEFNEDFRLVRVK